MNEAAGRGTLTCDFGAHRSGVGGFGVDGVAGDRLAAVMAEPVDLDRLAAGVRRVSARSEAWMASSTVNMFRQFGNVLGASVLGSILTSQFADNLTHDLHQDGLPAEVVDQVVGGAEAGTQPRRSRPVSPTRPTTPSTLRSPPPTTPECSSEASPCSSCRSRPSSSSGRGRPSSAWRPRAGRVTVIRDGFA